MNDWRVARDAVKDGRVVFFPRLTVNNVYSIFAYDRRKGLRITAKRVVYSQALGCMAWKVDEDAQ